MRRLVSLAALAASLAGCAAIPINLQTPGVDFVDMRALEANLFEQRLEVRMRVSNPNDVELPVNGLDVAVELDGEPFAKGMSAREFLVPARGQAEFDMIVTANAANALLKILGSDRKSREQVEYRLTGELSTRLGLLRKIPIDESGTVSVGELFGKRRKPD